MSGRKSSVVLLSGGIDSAVVLAFLVDQGWPVEALFIDYGQLPVDRERCASRGLAAAYDADWEEVSVAPLRTAPFSEVPGRNDMLVAIAAAARPASHVAVGVHAGTRYVDCSPAYVDAWQALFDLEYGGSRQLLVPLREFSKPAVLELAAKLSVPLGLTWSCEDHEGPCGVCSSCRDIHHHARS
jgi:7-cyano-7-deazaguanine synthase